MDNSQVVHDLTMYLIKDRNFSSAKALTEFYLKSRLEVAAGLTGTAPEHLTAEQQAQFLNNW